MKKVFLIAALSAISFAGFSQTSKGTWLVGGTAGFTSSKYGDAKMSSINFSPNAGYFLINNLAVGLDVQVGSETSNSGVSGASDYKTSSTFFGPNVRYYFTSLGKNAKLFGSGQYAFGSTKDGSDKISATAWGLSAGPAFFLNKNVALEVTVGYSSAKVKDDTNSTNSFGIRAGFQIHL
jgi:hypothetical protein